MTESICDWCGTHKTTCSTFKGCMVCQDCQHEYKQAREKIVRAEMATMIKHMEGRTTNA